LRPARWRQRLLSWFRGFPPTVRPHTVFAVVCRCVGLCARPGRAETRQPARAGIRQHQAVLWVGLAAEVADVLHAAAEGEPGAAVAAAAVFGDDDLHFAGMVLGAHFLV